MLKRTSVPEFLLMTTDKLKWYQSSDWSTVCSCLFVMLPLTEANLSYLKWEWQRLWKVEHVWVCGDFLQRRVQLSLSWHTFRTKTNMCVLYDNSNNEVLIWKWFMSAPTLPNFTIEGSMPSQSTVIYHCALFIVDLAPISVNSALQTKVDISFTFSDKNTKKWRRNKKR